MSCSICLYLLKDPVTTPCGHSYCMNCIKNHWDKEDERNIYSNTCPLCRTSFRPRPVLVKSTMLAELVEELKKTGLQAAPADHCYAGTEDVACDSCTGRKLKAIKSCLICLVSYCEKHLQPHLDGAVFRKHKLVEPSKNLQENICSRHSEVMNMFCRTDQHCYLCSVEEHKGHDTVSAAAERTERQREPEVSRPNNQQRIQDRQRYLKVLQQEVEVINGSADKAVEGSEEIFTEMIRVMEKRRRNAKQQVRSQQETKVSRVRELQEKLEQEITELKRKESEAEQLSNTADHNQFLHNHPSVPALSEPPHSCVTVTVSQLRDQLQDVLRKRWTNRRIGIGDVSLSEPEPKTRAEFLRYSREITLDPNPANKWLLFSDGNRKATNLCVPQSYSSHPDRFTDYYSQVLSRESLTRRCYWEVEWKGVAVGVAVSYKSIMREGWSEECIFGFNVTSWILFCFTNSYLFYHNSVKTRVSGPRSTRIGVYLDHSTGNLSFYSVSETMTLLHRVWITSTEPLYAGLKVYTRSTAEFSQVK